MRDRDARVFLREKSVEPASRLKRWILLAETPFEVASRAGAPVYHPHVKAKPCRVLRCAPQP